MSLRREIARKLLVAMESERVLGASAIAEIAQPVRRGFIIRTNCQEWDYRLHWPTHLYRARDA